MAAGLRHDRDIYHFHCFRHIAMAMNHDELVAAHAARPVIFPDAVFAATYDRRARENLARELASLS